MAPELRNCLVDATLLMPSRSELGASAYVVKPVKSEKLLGLVDGLMQRGA